MVWSPGGFAISKRLADSSVRTPRGGSRQRTVVLVSVALGALAASRPAAPSDLRVVGEWRGTSICMNRGLAPACKDESTRYVFTGPVAGSNRVHLVADKVVSGAFATMGEMDVEYAESTGVWSHVIDARACPACRWWFRVEGAHLIGWLTTSAGDTLRVVSATRFGPSSPFPKG
jgi:hypothetical protein